MIPMILDDSKDLKLLVDDRTNGLGRLKECVSCTVTEERNGPYEAEFKVPVDARHYKDLHLGGLLWFKAGDSDKGQIFRIYACSKPLNGIVTFQCRHISYDLSKASVLPFTSTGAVNTCAKLLANLAVSTPFTFDSDIENTTSVFELKVPKSFRGCLGGYEGSILDTFGGEYEWDNLKVHLHAKRGQDRGVTIRYGKNLTDIRQEENLEKCFNAVLPFASDTNGTTTVGTLITLSKAQYPRVFNLDLSNSFRDSDSVISKEKIDALAAAYVSTHDLRSPSVSITVRFTPLHQTEQYKNLAPLERVNLCDTVHVEFPSLGITASAKVVKTVYDVLKERYEELEIGDAKSSLSETITDIEKKNNNVEARAYSFTEQAVAHMTSLITGGAGGYVVFGRNADNAIEEILIMDTNDKTTATNIIRMNKSGIAFSNNGYGGPYVSGWGIDGTFNASYLTGKQLQAVLILGSQLIFGTEPNTVTLRTNDENTGGIFEGAGTINFSTNGAFTVRNNDSSGKAANSIAAANTSESSTLSNNNFFNGVQTNYNNMAGSASGSQYFIGNRFDNQAANRLLMNAVSSQHEILLQNYIFGGVKDGDGNVFRSNELHFNRTDTFSKAVIRNYSLETNGQLNNYLDLYSSAAKGYSYLQNNYNGKAANFLWLYQGTGSDKSVNYSIWLANRNIDSTKDANGIHLESSASQNKLSILNRNLSGTMSNGLYLTFSNNNNTLDFENYSTAGKTVNNLYMNYNSGTPYMGMYNRNSGSTVLNSVVLGTGASNDYLNFTNLKPDGQGGNSLNFSAGGSNNWIRISNQQMNHPANWANTLYWFSTNGGYNAFYLENYKDNSSLGIANRILLASSTSGNSLQLQNFQYSNPSVTNGQITISDSITYQCQNWHNFTFTGNDRQFRISGATHVFINGVDILGKLGIAAQ